MAKKSLQRDRYIAKKIVVLGIGHIGLPQAVILAKLGYKVLAVDINKKIVRAINKGIPPVKEKDLDEAFTEDRVKQNLVASLKPSEADVFIVAVQTPLEMRRKVADLSYVVSAVNSILPFLKRGNLVIIESTIPPLTCREIVKPLIEKKTRMKIGKDIFLAHCPERISPGNAMYEIIHNSRIIGTIDSKSALKAKEVYSSFVKGRLLIVDDVTAETVKLMENTYRDVNVALANEFSLIAETLGIDVRKAIELANTHPRVNILSPGIGVGGHCLPKDPWFLIQADPMNATLIQAARKINDGMPERICSKIRRALRNIDKPKIVALGMTYKPDSDDLRESSALKVVEILKEEGYDVMQYDNFVRGFEYNSIREIAKNVDCIVVLVEHTEMKKELEDFNGEIKLVMRTPKILRPGTSYVPDFYDMRQRGFDIHTRKNRHFQKDKNEPQ